MGYENIRVEKRGKVGLITLDRPKALNALNSALVAELGTALDGFDADERIGCIVITGSEKALPPVPTSRKCSRTIFRPPIRRT